MASTSNATDLVALCKTAFDPEQEDAQQSQIALKNLANVLLLEQKARQQFAESGKVKKVADKLRVR